MPDKITLTTIGGDDITAEADGRVFTLVVPFGTEEQAQQMLEFCADMSLKGQVVFAIDTAVQPTNEGSRALN